MDNLTPTLNEQQLKQNIDALQQKGLPTDQVQSYVNNYSKDSTGNYVLKSAQPLQPAQPSARDLAVKQGLSTVGGGTPVPTSSIIAGARSIYHNDIQQPIVNAFAIPTQAITNVLGLPDPFKGGIPDVIGGGTSQVAPLTGQTALQKAGAIGQTAINLMIPGAKGIIPLAKVGALSGASNSLAAGNTDPKQVATDAGVGSIFMGMLGALGDAARGVMASQKYVGGISPAIETELTRIRPQTLKAYIEAAQNSASDFHVQNASELFQHDVRNGLNILENTIQKQAGDALNAAHETSGHLPVVANVDGGPQLTGASAVDSVRNDINGVMSRLVGHQFSSEAQTGLGELVNPSGEPFAPTGGLNASPDGAIEPLPGRSLDLSSADKKALENVDAQLQKLRDNPTVQTASDVTKNLDRSIDWQRAALNPHDPVDGVIRYARGAVRRIIEPAAPELAQANMLWGKIQAIKGTLADTAGKDLQNLDLLGRRVVYDGQTGRAQSALDELFNIVKPNLPAGEESYTTKAILSRFANDTFGGLSSQSGHAQKSQALTTGDVSGTLSHFGSGVIRAILNIGSKVIAPNPEEYAMSIAKGEPYSFVPFMHKIDQFLDSPQGNFMKESAKGLMNKLGITGNTASKAGVNLMKALILQSVTQPNQSSIMAPFSQPNTQGSLLSQPQPTSMAPQTGGRALSINTPVQSALTQMKPAQNRSLSLGGNTGINLSA